MAAFTTGSSWSFPEDLPGGWTAEDELKPTPTTSPQEGHPLPDHHSPFIEYDGSAEDDTAPEQPPHRGGKQYPPRTCRICLEVVQPTYHFNDSPLVPDSLKSAPRVSYESEDGGRLLRPCKCKGSQAYVHEECLGAWRKADPLKKRNYYECPTCRYRYHLQRLTWASWMRSTSAQIGLTLAILAILVFLLGFVADPLINLYLDPVSTIATAGGPTGSLIYEDDTVGWAEHFAKGFASLGLVGFAKAMITMSPWHFLRIGGGGGTGVGRSGVAGTGRDRMRELSWITILIGIVTILYAIWKGVRAWSRRTLESAGERVMDVPGSKDDDDDE
ncbi:hypothetical protein LTR95_017302 [Oleoguttula sp. CCFEE 5521]